MPDVTASHIIDSTPPPPHNGCLTEVVAMSPEWLLSLGLWAEDFTSTGCWPYFGCPTTGLSSHRPSLQPKQRYMSPYERVSRYFKYPRTPAPYWFPVPYSIIRNTLPYFVTTLFHLPTLYTLTCRKRTGLRSMWVWCTESVILQCYGFRSLVSETRHEQANGRTRNLSMPPQRQELLVDTSCFVFTRSQFSILTRRPAILTFFVVSVSSQRHIWESTLHEPRTLPSTFHAIRPSHQQAPIIRM
jgi:hypothetical protein